MQTRLKTLGRVLAVYLGSSWVLMEVFIFLTQRYGLPPGLQDVLLLLITFALPIVIINNWYKSWKNKYAIILISLNVFVASWLIGSAVVKAFKETETVNIGSITGEDNKINSVAVLPFENLTGEKDIEHIIDGIHSAISNKLGGIGRFIVISDRSTRKYKGSHLSISEIAEELNVGAIVDGVVLGSTDSMRIQVSLVTPSPEKQIWADAFDQSTNNILKMYSDIAGKITQQIDKTFNPDTDLVPPVEAKKEAVYAYWKGRSHQNRLTREDLELGLEYYNQAIRHDSSYAPAYAGIASAWVVKAQMNVVPFHEAAKEGRQYIEKALELDNNDANVHSNRATYYGWAGWDWDIAYEGFLRAIRLNPSLAGARAGYAFFLVCMKENDEAKYQIRKALELDPPNQFYLSFYAMILNFSGDYDKVIDLLTDKEGNITETALSHSTLRTTYHLMGDQTNAIKMWELYYEDRKDTAAVTIIRKIYKKEGYGAALTALGELMEYRKKNDIEYVPAWNLCTIYLRAGEHDRSLKWLEKAFEEHSVNMPSINTDPIFDPIKDHPRFMAVHEKMKFPESIKAEHLLE